jgi:hypothetical protein
MSEKERVGSGVWAVIDQELACPEESEPQLAQYHERSRMAPAVFLLPGREVAMLGSWAIESRDRVRAAIARLPDHELPQAMAHTHPLVR